MDMILNGQAHGDVASLLMNNNFDAGALRPYVGPDGRSYVTVNGVAQPVFNAAATLRKDEWIQLDETVVKAARARLRFVADLRGAGLTYGLTNGLGKTILQTEKQSDAGSAVISMDGLREGPQDRPKYDIDSLPLPIIHSDFSFSARQIATSRNGNTPLDTSMAEMAGRKVAEEAEKLALGKSDFNSYAYGGGTIYGLTNFTHNNTKTLTAPTDSSWTGATLVNEVLEMKLQSQQDYHYGPWMIYTSPSWDVFLDADYSASKGDNTVRDRLKKIDGIQDVRTLDYLTNYELVLVQMTSDVVREVVGMDVTTLQWPEKGGLAIHFKVMAILVPQFRADYNDRTGIVYGSTAA